jgi:hypothetical protein
MKKLYYLTLIFLFTCLFASAQVTVNISLNSSDEDATIDDYNSGGNYPNEIDYHVSAWTISGTQTIWRNLFKFDLRCIPSNAVIQSARLSLFYADTNSYVIYANGEQSSLTNSNESVLQRVTSAWTENTVTWINQPATTTADQVILPQSTSATQDYTNLDVTQMVQLMIGAPANNNGFELKLTNETYYAQLLFASGDNPHIAKHPNLEITYTIPTFACHTLTISSADEDATIDDYNSNGNYPNEIDYHVSAWTISSTPAIWRNLFKFDLSCIPPNVVVNSALLSLFYADTNSYVIYANGLQSSLTSSNESVIQRVTSPWAESTVNWNNQPATTTADQVILAQSTSGTQDYTNLDVTQIVQQMTGSPSNNNGFELKLTNETYYAQMLFASGDNPHQNKHPVMEVCYTLGTNIKPVNTSLNVFITPNPASDILWLQLSKDLKGLIYQILDAIGRSVSDESELLTNSSYGNAINVSDLSSGLYFLQIKTNEQIITKKFIKQ